MEQMTILYAQKLLEELMDSSSSSDEDEEFLAVLSQINERESNENSTKQKENSSPIKDQSRLKSEEEKTNDLDELEVVYISDENTMEQPIILNNPKKIDSVEISSTYPVELDLCCETIADLEQELSNHQHIYQESEHIVSPTIEIMQQSDTSMTWPTIIKSPIILSTETSPDREEILPTPEPKQQPVDKVFLSHKNTPQQSKNLNKNTESAAVLTENELEVKANKFVNQVMKDYSEKEFKQRFQFSRNTAIYLMEKYSLWFFNTSYKESSHKVMVEINILTFLWFCGNGTTMQDIADMFNISSLYMQKNFKNVLKFLIDEMSPQVIKFPTTISEKEAVANEFKEVAGFPNVLGCVADSFFPIRTQKLAQRIKSSLIYLRGICDAKLRFLNVKTGIPKDVISDTFMEKYLPKLCFPKYHLLADEKCSIKEYLMTPFPNADNLDESEKYFNIKLYRTHVKIKNTFGNLRSRFRQLKYLNLDTFEMMSDFIIACCVLHNICIDRDDFHNEQIYTDVSDRRHRSSLAAIKCEDFRTDLGIMKRFELKNVLFNTKT